MKTVIGVLIAIVAYSMLNIGMALQKKGADKLPKIEKTSGLQNFKNFLTNRTWLLGWVLSTANWYVFLVALIFAPVSLLCPMMGAGLVVLVFFARFYLKESVTRTEIVGIAVIALGTVLLSLTPAKAAVAAELASMHRYYGSADSLLFTVFSLGCVGAAMAYTVLRKFQFADLICGISCGVLMGLAATYSKGFASGFAGSSFIGTLTNIPWYGYTVVVILGNMGGLVVQQMGFQHGKAVIVTPLSAVFNLMFGVLGGVFTFGEWESLSVPAIVLKIAALAAIMAGVAILSVFRIKTENGEREYKEIQ